MVWYMTYQASVIILVLPLLIHCATHKNNLSKIQSTMDK